MSNKNNIMHSKERGAVSIFIVIFTALLVTIVTTSFIQIMLKNQQQASNNDLSQSAYDSAMAGVEDAKRALVRLRKCELDPSLLGCAAFKSTLVNDGGTKCEILGDASINVATFVNGEVPVADTAGGQADLNQAYTCVKVTVNTKSYEGTLSGVKSVVIPLKGASQVNKIKISWFAEQDIPNDDPKNPVTPTLPLTKDLVPYTSWPNTMPPILRSQLIQFESGAIDLNAFDAPNTPNAKSLFLYPFDSLAASINHDFNIDTRRQGAGSVNDVTPTGCERNFSTTDLLCSAIITLPDLPDNSRREAYLQLAAIYASPESNINYRIEMCTSTCAGDIVDFNGVQPIVDSTGRASDLFRRVQARITVSDSGDHLDYPDAALTIGKNLCKDFFVTDDRGDYNSNASGDDQCEASAPN